MQNKDCFSSCHPLVSFAYFAFVIGFSMFFMHPVCLFVSLFCALFYYIQLNGKKSVRHFVNFALPMLILTAVINPLFNHQGTTILCYLPKGNPLTLESIAYGIAAGVMLVSILLWFGCFNLVMTSDKFVYLFGRLIPSLSLVISMTLRFVPKFKTQFKSVKEAQAGISAGIQNNNLQKKIKNFVSCFSIMVTWSLENALETADSMKSRGYGLKGRTAFSIFKFTSKDKYVLAWILFCAIYIISVSLSGSLHCTYFPNFSAVIVHPRNISAFVVYFALSIMPIIINVREEKKWESLKSKI